MNRVIFVTLFFISLIQVMKIFFFTFLLSTLILISSCNDNSNKRHPKQVLLKDSITIDLPSNVPKVRVSNPWSMHKGVFSFSVENINFSMIYSYDFDKAIWSDEKYTYPDDNGIIGDAHFLLTDNLSFFNPKKDSNQLLIFQSDTLFKKLKFNKFNDLLGSSENLPDLTSKSHFKIDEKQLYFAALNSSIINASNLKKMKLYGKYNLQTDAVSFHGDQPQDFEEHSNLLISNLRKNIAIGKNKILINFPKLPYLLVYGKENDNFIKKTICENKNVHNIKQLEKQSNKEMASLKNHLSGNYDKVLYNKEKKVYYRISTYYENYDKLDVKQLLKNAFQLKRTRIHVMDNDLKTIAVNDFKGLSEHFIMLYNGELLIRSGHDQPDKLVFKKFQLSP